MATPGKAPPAKEPSKHKYSLLRRALTLKAQTQGTVMKPWMQKLALWYADQMGTPKLEEGQAAAQKILRQNVSLNTLRAVLRNPAWQAQVKQLEEEIVTQSRTRAELRTPKAIEQHFDALDELMAAGKWADVAKFTVPLLDRVWPKDQGTVSPAQIIQITVGAPGSFAAVHAKAGGMVEIQSTAEVLEEKA